MQHTYRRSPLLRMRKSTIHDYHLVKGSLEIETFDASVGIRRRYIYPNLVLNTGKAILINRMLSSPTEGVISHMAVGSGTTPAALTQTALVTELGRVTLDSTSVVTVNTTDDSIRYVATFAPGVATGTWNEAGLSNTASSTITFSRAILGTISKTAGMNAVITWTVTLV